MWAALVKQEAPKKNLHRDIHAGEHAREAITTSLDPAWPVGCPSDEPLPALPPAHPACQKRSA
jgi:hypothetical protein